MTLWFVVMEIAGAERTRTEGGRVNWWGYWWEDEFNAKIL